MTYDLYVKLMVFAAVTIHRAVSCTFSNRTTFAEHSVCFYESVSFQFSYIGLGEAGIYGRVSAPINVCVPIVGIAHRRCTCCGLSKLMFVYWKQCNRAHHVRTDRCS